MPPLKLAIIGAGPSAFYATSRLLTLVGSNQNVRVHIYDRLWAPYGLVRYGVAPDHPEVKNCTHKFDVVASDPRVRFFGNVNIVPSLSSLAHSSPRSSPVHTLQLPLQQLTPYYTHLLLATGAPIPKLHPSLPPSRFCIPALDIVHWYTRHPSSPYNDSTTSSAWVSPLPPSPTHLTILGHGNVSLDILRILLTKPSVLSTLDMPSSTLAILSSLHHSLRHISIIGRRGPQDVRFGARELREAMKIDGATMLPIPEGDFGLGGGGGTGAVASGTQELTRQQTRILKLLREGSKRPVTPGDKTFSIEFYKTPTGYTTEGGQALLRLERAGPGSPHTTETLPTNLIITSLGYDRDFTLMEALHDRFDARSCDLGLGSGSGVQTATGESTVTTNSTSLVPPPFPPHIFMSGWAAHGARGVLAGTLIDAAGVAGDIVKDWNAEGDIAGECGSVKGKKVDAMSEEKASERTGIHLASPFHIPGGIDSVPETLQRGLSWRGQEQERASSDTDSNLGVDVGVSIDGADVGGNVPFNPPVIEFSDWLLIDAEERRRGQLEGKERERMQWSDAMRYLRN